MSDNEESYRVSAYVSKEAYEKLLKLQTEERIKQNKRVSQGYILEKLLTDEK